jgi:hypothetical protein
LRLTNCVQTWFTVAIQNTEVSMVNTDGKFYSLQMRLIKDLPGDSASPRVELTALPEDPAEAHVAHLEHWDSLSDRLRAVARSTPFHLKVMYRTLHAGLTAPLIDRATGARQVFSSAELKALGAAH